MTRWCSEHLKAGTVFVRFIHTKEPMRLCKRSVMRELRKSVPFANILIDEDGIGGGVVDNLRRC